MKQKAIIFDASSLITFAMNGLLNELKNLKKIFPGKFLITQEVKKEIIDTPIKIKRFELEALKLNELLKEKILELPESIGIKQNLITEKTNQLLTNSNKIFFQKGNQPIEILHSGETACIALGKILKEKNIENVLAVDERTVRLLIENPENLKKILQKKLHAHINLKKENLENLKDLKIIRSSELIYIANKNNLIEIKDKRIFDAILYSLRYKGCAISFEEIEEMKRLSQKNETKT